MLEGLKGFFALHIQIPEPLAAMQDAAKYGLGRMPAVEPAIASLIVAPEETLRQDARCPRPQW